MRTSPSLKAALLLAVAASLSACDDEKRVANELPTAPASVPANALSAFVTVSDSRPDVGQRLDVTVRALRGAAVGRIGSFTLRLVYDSTRLQLIETGRSQHGMVMANGNMKGLIVAAGASGEGFTDDRLLTATFLVTGARAIPSLSLDVSELNSIAFQDQKSAMKIDSKIYRAERN